MAKEEIRKFPIAHECRHPACVEFSLNQMLCVRHENMLADIEYARDLAVFDEHKRHKEKMDDIIYQYAKRMFSFLNNEDVPII